MNRSTMLDDGLSAYVPRIIEGRDTTLLARGRSEACEAAIGNSPCILRKGIDGIWRTWRLCRP